MPVASLCPAARVRTDTCLFLAGDFGDTAVQGQLVHQLRYLASVVTQNFSAFGELLAMPKRFAEISGGITRVGEALEVIDKSANLDAATRAALTSAEQQAGGINDTIQFRCVLSGWARLA